MHLQLQQPPSYPFFGKILFCKQFNGQHDQTKDKDQNTDAVDAVHIFYPLRIGTFRIGFAQV